MHCLGFGNWSCMEASGCMLQRTQGDCEHMWGIFFIPWRGDPSIILVRLSARIPTQLHCTFTIINERMSTGGHNPETDFPPPTLSDSQLPSRIPRPATFRAPCSTSAFSTCAPPRHRTESGLGRPSCAGCAVIGAS